MNYYGVSIGMYNLIRPFGIRYFSNSAKHALASKIASVYSIIKLHDPEAIEVPTNFVVPYTNLWPVELHGFNASDGASRLRQLSKIVPNCFDQDSVNLLNTLKFPWSKLEGQARLLMLALRRYKQIHGHLCIPQDCVIDKNDVAYPVQIRGMKLGYRVNKIRSKGSYEEFHGELSAMGFVFDDSKEKARLILIALNTYKAKYGNLFIPRAYEIKHGDNSFPLEVQGMQLGIIVSNIRKGCFKKFTDDFKKIGFIFDMREFARLALSHYYTLNKTKTKPMERNFVVPCTSRWPKEMWNLPLGALNNGCILKPRTNRPILQSASTNT